MRPGPSTQQAVIALAVDQVNSRPAGYLPAPPPVEHHTDRSPSLSRTAPVARRCHARYPQRSPC